MKTRVMARRVQPAGQARRAKAGLAVAVAVLVLVAAIGVSGIFAGGASPTPVPGVANNPSGSGTASPDRRTTLNPSDAVAPEPSASPTDAPTHRPRPTPTSGQTVPPSSSAGGGGAPTSPREFDLAAQRIDIGFPLLPESKYHYRDNFLDLRDGSPDAYNHARTSLDGTARRLHDGIDIYAAENEPLVAPFTGTVIDPGARWQPWERSRYGNTVVIESDERGTRGYVALLVHMARVWVEPGARVTRGQVVGTLGRTGNAEDQSIRAHVHFELRAPFLLDWSPFGEARAIDAFNPYPSLVAADAKGT